MQFFSNSMTAEGASLAQLMEAISIDFLESFPDGARRLTTANWAGACVVISRNRIDSALRVANLTRPGVYILVGPSEVTTNTQPPKLVSKIYIGKSELLDERLRNHHDSKEFWSTAFAFHRRGQDEDDLHSGQIAQLEALLIEKAHAAGNHVQNIANPKHRGKQSELESMNTFASQIEAILKALGHDLFTPQNQPEPALTERHEHEEIKVPENLQSVIDQLKGFCLALAQTEFYATRIPDLRAKVVHGESSRVFATIKFRKHAVLLHRPGGTFISLDEHSTLGTSVREELKIWHDAALQRLTK